MEKALSAASGRIFETLKDKSSNLALVSRVMKIGNAYLNLIVEACLNFMDDCLQFLAKMVSLTLDEPTFPSPEEVADH